MSPVYQDDLTGRWYYEEYTGARSESYLTEEEALRAYRLYVAAQPRCRSCED